jgi:hypothetical protein
MCPITFEARRSEDLLGALEYQPLLAIVGRSGSGKSSLVFADVAAVLRVFRDWRIAASRRTAVPSPRRPQAVVTLCQSAHIELLVHSADLLRRWESGTIGLAENLPENLRQSRGERLSPGLVP